MAKFTGFQFHQTVKDLDGNEVMRQEYPTKEELAEARKAGRENVELKEVPLTVQYALRLALVTDLSKKVNGQVVEPDVHEEKKFELYELARKIVHAGPTDEPIVLESEEISLLKTRIKKMFDVVIYGFLHELLEGKNSDFNVVSK